LVLICKVNLLAVICNSSYTINDARIWHW